MKVTTIVGAVVFFVVFAFEDGEETRYTKVESNIENKLKEAGSRSE